MPNPIGRTIRRAFWLDARRLHLWSSILLLQELGVFAFMVAGTHGLIVPLEHPVTTDYVSFYAAGELANHGAGALAYDRAAHGAAEQAVTQPGVPYVYFFYPPVFLLLCSVLARLPYVLSLLVFEAVSFALYLLAMGRVVRGQGWRWMIPVAAFPACFVAAGMGQNSFLTSALFAAATLLLDRRPGLAGVIFGLLCYKPHFGVLLPLLLAVGGYWRSIATAGVTVLALAAASASAFGWETWRAYGVAFQASHAVYEGGAVRFSAFVTPFGAARLMALPPVLAYAVQIAVSLIVIGLTAWLWRRDRRPAIRYAALIAGTMLAVPLALYYDLVIETVAIAWLVRDNPVDALPQWEKLSFVAIYACTLLTAGVGNSFALPLGPVCAVLLLGICTARSLRHYPPQTVPDHPAPQPAGRYPRAPGFLV